jgi:hypothetical protein
MSEESQRREAMVEKVKALLAALDRNAAFCGMPPLAGARGVAHVRVLTKADWRALARQAGCNAPSKATVALIIEALEARRPMRKTTPVPAQLPLVGRRAG